METSVTLFGKIFLVCSSLMLSYVEKVISSYDDVYARLFDKERTRTIKKEKRKEKR